MFSKFYPCINSNHTRHFMLSKKLIASLGVELKDVSSVPKILKRKTRKKTLLIHDIYACPSNEPKDEDASSISSYTSYSSYSSSQEDEDEFSSNSSQETNSKWVQEYEEATESQYTSQLNQLKQELEELKHKVYTSSFLDKLEKADDAKKKEELQRCIDQLEKSASLETKQLSTMDHEECAHCGMVGMVQINVHRCIKHCMACHRQSSVEHFYETTGTNLMTTNPGRYTRRGHFISTLKKIQAKRPVKLPPTLLGEVKKYFQEYYGVEEPKDVEYKDMKDVLKALGYNDKKGKGDFMDHIMAIYCQLTGRNPPRFTISENQTLIGDFDKLDVKFEQACYELGVERTNWLSYEFTIYKLCEKNNYDNMKDWFGILKGPQTLKSQDEIMGKMFELNKWKFQVTKPPVEEAPQPQSQEVPKKRNKTLVQSTPKILDMMSFLEHHRSFIPKPIDVLRIDDHIMSTEEEEEDEDVQKTNHASVQSIAGHKTKTKRIRKRKRKKEHPN